jgi:hypothetical protein
MSEARGRSGQTLGRGDGRRGRGSLKLLGFEFRSGEVIQ